MNLCPPSGTPGCNHLLLEGSVRRSEQCYSLIIALFLLKILGKNPFTGVTSTMTGQSKNRRELDRMDRSILRILQQEGRISFTELGERVNLSTTPCTERVRRLERDGVILGDRKSTRLNSSH